jgi:hypothetical protein
MKTHFRTLFAVAALVVGGYAAHASTVKGLAIGPTTHVFDGGSPESAPTIATAGCLPLNDLADAGGSPSLNPAGAGIAGPSHPCSFVEATLVNLNTLPDAGYDPFLSGGHFYAWHCSTNGGCARQPAMDLVIANVDGGGAGSPLETYMQGQSSLVFPDVTVNVAAPGDKLCYTAGQDITSVGITTKASLFLECQLVPSSLTSN